MTNDDLTAALLARAAGIYPLEAGTELLATSRLPCSGGELRILQLSASLAAGTPVSLRNTVTGPGRRQHRPARHRDPTHFRQMT